MLPNRVLPGYGLAIMPTTGHHSQTDDTADLPSNNCENTISATNSSEGDFDMLTNAVNNNGITPKVQLPVNC